MTMPADLIERARGVPLDAVAAHLKLRRIGQELVGPCPVDGGTDRFAINPGRGKWNCRGAGGGCDAIGLAMHIYAVDFRAAIEMLTGERSVMPRQAPAQRQAPARKSESDTSRLVYADAIWRAAVPAIAGTPGEAYLRDRGIDLGEAPDCGGLRFHPACPYGRLDLRSDGPRRILPCVLARYTDIFTGAPWGIHRRTITAGIEPKTMSLGPVPPGRAIVRLWPDEEVTQGLVIGEGIETVLAAATRIEHRGALLRPAWACGTAGNLEVFPVLPGIEALVVLADADENGRGQEAAERCAGRWVAAGREVTILTPRDLGTDFNDLVRAA